MNTPEIPQESVKILWCEDWYDGPLTGMCEVAGERLHFRLVDQTEDRWREYELVRPTPGQLAEVERRHALFLMHVGPFHDYTNAAKDWPPRKEAEWRLFYEAQKGWPEMDWASCPVVGRFRL